MGNRIDILPTGQNVYKANLHSHSTLSDGVMTPLELKTLYKKHGYSVFAYTDHRILHRHDDLADENFLPIAGYELDFNIKNEKGMNIKTCHINALALDPDKAVQIEGEGPYDIQVINDAIKRLRKNGFIVNLNHPSWSNQMPEEVLRLEGLTAMELVNSACSWIFDSAENQLHYETSIKAGRRILALYADDNHSSSVKFGPKYKGKYAPGAADFPESAATEIPAQDSCRSYTMIYAPKLEYKLIMDSFVAGRYYCSCGPEILAFYIEDDRICLDCSPVSSVFLRTMAWAISTALMDIDGNITHAEFDLNKLKSNKEGFFRIELIDKLGRKACTNPYYL